MKTSVSSSSLNMAKYSKMSSRPKPKQHKLNKKSALQLSI